MALHVLHVKVLGRAEASHVQMGVMGLQFDSLQDSIDKLQIRKEEESMRLTPAWAPVDLATKTEVDAAGAEKRFHEWQVLPLNCRRGFLSVPM